MNIEDKNFQATLENEKETVHRSIRNTFEKINPDGSIKELKWQRLGFLFEELTHAWLDVFITDKIKSKGLKFISITVAALTWIPMLFVGSIYLLIMIGGMTFTKEENNG